MEETIQRLTQDVKKLRKRTTKLTLFAVIAGLYIASLEIRTKEQSEKINEAVGNQTTEGV